MNAPIASKQQVYRLLLAIVPRLLSQTLMPTH
jgi:hypothetical protein